MRVMLGVHAMSEDAISAMQRILECQKLEQINSGAPSIELRRNRLDRAIALLVDNKQALSDAITADFGSRPHLINLIADVAAPIATLKYARAHLAKWMRPESRQTTPGILGLFGAKAWVEYQPKGVVGILSPWNFPINLVFGPLAGIFAAGNRAMVKPSELTPRTSALLAELCHATFDENEVAVIQGGADIGAAFAALPFDHLIFTGSTRVGRHVMRAASENLTPVTLELGGKSPVIIGESADLALAVKRILFWKTLNAGQICTAPDYAVLPEGLLEKFIELAKRSAQQMFPRIENNPDYGAIINAQHFTRLQDYLSDAKAKGARIVELQPVTSGYSEGARIIPPTLIVGMNDGMRVMQEEIFGPLLPLMIGTVDDAIAYVNAHPRPLALYYFGRHAAEERKILRATTSGNVSINDTVMHYGMEDLPFGGVGPSGIGAYHGIEGFRTFSHAKGIFRQSRFDVARTLRPPFGRVAASRVLQQINK